MSSELLPEESRRIRAPARSSNCAFSPLFSSDHPYSLDAIRSIVADYLLQYLPPCSSELEPVLFGRTLLLLLLLMFAPFRLGIEMYKPETIVALLSQRAVYLRKKKRRFVFHSCAAAQQYLPRPLMIRYSQCVRNIYPFFLN